MSRKPSLIRMDCEIDVFKATCSECRSILGSDAVKCSKCKDLVCKRCSTTDSHNRIKCNSCDYKVIYTRIEKQFHQIYKEHYETVHCECCEKAVHRECSHYVSGFKRPICTDCYYNLYVAAPLEPNN